MTAGPGEPLDAARASLVKEFSGVFAPETVETCLTDSYQQLLPARVHGYLPLLAHRFARERLNASSRDLVAATERVPLVLFVCTANSGRSQVAAALLAHEAGERVEVASAGTQPADEVQPEVVTALAEIGISAGDLFPKPLTDEVVGGADIVITMGCGDTCPVIPGRRYLDWSVTDPAGLNPAGVRGVRDDIADRMTLLLTELLPSRTQPV